MPDERDESRGFITATDAMRLPEPEPVLRQDLGGPDGAVVCSVGEPAILAGPGGTGKSWLTLMWACAGAEGAARADERIANAKAESEAAAEAAAEAEDTFQDEVNELAQIWRDEHAATTEAAVEAAEAEADVVSAAFSNNASETLEDTAAAEARAVVAAEVGAAVEYAVEAEAEAQTATSLRAPWQTSCGLAVRPGPVLLVSYEDRPARIAARLRAMEVTERALKRLHIAIDPEPLWKPADRSVGGACVTSAFRALSEQLGTLRPSLLVLDPISAAADSLNLNDGGAARYAVRSLAKLSADRGVGILVVAHDTKSARESARADSASPSRLPGAGAVAGSAQWFDATRGVLYLRLGPKKEAPNIDRELVALKVNNGVDGWDVPLARDDNDEGVFRGFRLTTDTRTAPPTTGESSQDAASLTEEDIPF